MKDIFGNVATILPEENEEEIWVPTDDFGLPGFSVSSFGNIRNEKTQHVRTLYPNKNGYLKSCNRVKNKDGKYVSKDMNAHRLVAMAFWGKPEGTKNIVDHIDGCRCNNYYKNIRWTDHFGNRANRHCQKKYIGNWDKTPIVQLNPDTDEVIAYYDGVAAAVEATGISRCQLIHHLEKHRRPFQIGRFIMAAEFAKEKNF